METCMHAWEGGMKHREGCLENEGLHRAPVRCHLSYNAFMWARLNIVHL